MTASGARQFSGRVHVVGAGPVGLLTTALLQSMRGLSVRLYEKRAKYTRSRMVQLAPYLVADSHESYCVDHIDEENVDAVLEGAKENPLQDLYKFRRIDRFYSKGRIGNGFTAIDSDRVRQSERAKRWVKRRAPRKAGYRVRPASYLGNPSA